MTATVTLPLALASVTGDAGDGDPVLLDTSTPTYADPDCAVAWSGGVRTNVKADVSFKTLIGRGSGESFQISFQGAGWVLIQSSEGAKQQPTEAAQNNSPVKGLGSLLGN